MQHELSHKLQKITDIKSLPNLTIMVKIDYKGDVVSPNNPYCVLELDKCLVPYCVAFNNYEKAEPLPNGHPMKYYNYIWDWDIYMYRVVDGVTLDSLINKKKQR